MAEFTVKLAEGVPPKLTAVAPLKLVPVIITEVPAPAEVGENEVIVGTPDELKVKPAMEAVPSGVVTVTLPEEPLPTTAII